MESPEEIIEKMFERGILINKDLLNQDFPSTLLDRIDVEADMLVLNSDYINVISQPTSFVDWYEIDRYRVDAEKDRDDDLYNAHLQEFQKLSMNMISTAIPEISSTNEHSSLELQLGTTSSTEGLSLGLETSSAQIPSSYADDLSWDETTSLQDDGPSSLLPNISVVFNPNSKVTILIAIKNEPRKYEVKDFTSLFTSRYRFLSNLLRNRQELQGVLPLGRILQKTEKEKVSIIGMVREIGTTKAGNKIITLEDLTGSIKILFSKNNPEIFDIAKDLVVDEIIGIQGMYNDKFLFAEQVVWPDLPVQELKKSPIAEDEYAIFLSDIHVGSLLFLHEEFNKFLQWINGEMGNETQREIAKRVRYIFMVGDLVDGIGIYPTQETELAIKDIKEQYLTFTNLVKKIPSDKQIIMCPGNHDAVHLAEPQPAIHKEYAPELVTLPNVHLVTNPAYINIAKTDSFEGFTVLIYHGYSFDYYVANVESIRANGGYHRADLIMKFLLKRRHLAPSFKSTPYFPAHTEDPLLIKIVPDFFVTGHIHYAHIANYKSVTMISCSCWQGKTTFQEKLGHEPEPSRVPLVNLRTRDVKLLRFG